ncbi:F-box family protein [Euphorbia peplus]|nr:F-box family protein [Euphorbia peplus]
MSAEMSALPEGCIANVMSFTTPKSVGILSTVSPTFKNAAESDTVWEKFLPPDYLSILSTAATDSNSPALSSLTKKQLFLTLCNDPILIDHGRKSFQLSKWSGKTCFMLSPRDLEIVWGDTPSYWKWTSDQTSRFSEVAELVNICWFEIMGEFDTKLLSPSTMYSVFLVFKVKETAYGLDAPTVAMLAFGGEGVIRSRRNIYLEGTMGYRRPRRWLSGGDMQSLEFVARRELLRRFPGEREDGWIEVELGQFFNRGQSDLKIRVAEVEGGHWKSGLVVGGIEIRPVIPN